jgi:hypothetical protein
MVALTLRRRPREQNAIRHTTIQRRSQNQSFAAGIAQLTFSDPRADHKPMKACQAHKATSLTATPVSRLPAKHGHA